MKLTEHFSLEEFTASDTARAKKIDNTPNETAIANLKALCENILEPARIEYGKPISISSGYRCAKLNRAVGGVYNSQHQFGQAADLVCDDLPGLFAILAKYDVDQLLFERNSRGIQWLHVSFRQGGRNRHMIRNNYVVK